MNRFHRFASLLVAVLLASPLAAQDKLNFNLGGQLGSFGGGSAGEHVTFTGEYQIAKGSRDGKLSIKAEIEEGWHVYSVTQPDGGPERSVIKVASSADFELVGPFQPDAAPHIKPPDIFPVDSEEHELAVTWTAPIRVREGVDPAGLKFDVAYNGQVCGGPEGTCIPIKAEAVEITFADYYEDVVLSKDYRNDEAHVSLTGQIGPNVVFPGGTLKVAITAVPDEEWHIYAYEEHDPVLVSKPTIIGISKPATWTSSPATASVKPLEHESGIKSQPVLFFHEEPVTWTVEIKVPETAEPGEYTLEGAIGYQTCTMSSCDLPTSASFAAKVTVVASITDERNEIGFTAANYDELAKQLAPPIAEPAGESFSLDNIAVKPTETSGERPAVAMLLMAFGAGFILNFMPCVLPVIGLKLASFVHQAGHDRRKVLMLNLWYTFGVLAVFMVLATAATVFGLKWGQQFNNATFNAILTAIVFAFALSFLGVWEIPIPGFASNGKANELAEQEGAGGAFFKGILTTVLATPCSGPLLVPAVAWALRQPALITYSSFACVGLGLASPYLVIGAFPRLASWLPKPGAWMETFKHIMGFVLLGTVVMLLTFVPMSYVVPIVTFLIGLWAMLWWVGRVPLYDPLSKRIRVWAEGAIFAAVIYAFAFGWLQGVMEGRFNEAVAYKIAQNGGKTELLPRHENELAWLPYSDELLEQQINEGKTVFIDFTAPN